MDHISSLKNPRVAAWRSLKEKKGRDTAQAFLVEGPRMVEEALASLFPVRTLILRDGYLPPFELPETVQTVSLPEHVFRSVCDTKTPQGIAAVVGIQTPQLKGTRLLALDGIQDPGNMGTIIRTADAAGFEGIILSPDCVDLFSPKVLRATMGSIFRMSFSFPAFFSDSLKTFRDTHGYAVISSQLDGDPFFERKPIASPFILVVGNEGNGISDEVKAGATHRFRLPMRGGAESLNAAVAAGVMMYDLIRSELP